MDLQFMIHVNDHFMHTVGNLTDANDTPGIDNLRPLFDTICDEGCYDLDFVDRALQTGVELHLAPEAVARVVSAWENENRPGTHNAILLTLIHASYSGGEWVFISYPPKDALMHIKEATVLACRRSDDLSDEEDRLIKRAERLREKQIGLSHNIQRMGAIFDSLKLNKETKYAKL